MAEGALLELTGLHLQTAEAPQLSLVRDLSFTIHPGEVVGLVGESGSGKSLTALSLMDLLPTGVERASGSIRLDGQELTRLSPRQLHALRGSEVAYCFQDPASALNPVMRVGTQVEEVLRAHRSDLDRPSRKARVLELLEEVELPKPAELARRYPHELSGGQRQRVLLAAALAGDPRLLIGDEPTTALDVTIQEQILRLLERLRKQRGLAMLWISHDLQLVRGFCQRVLVLYQGALVESGTPADLFHHPQHPHTKALVAAAQAGRGAVAEAVEEPSPVCELRDLTVEYAQRGGWGRKAKPLRAVDSVGLRLHRGETLALVGESGSGKTTVGRAMLKLVDAQAGDMDLWLPDGSKVSWLQLAEAEARPLRRHLGMVFQDPVSALDPMMPIWKSVAEPLAIHRVASGAALRARAEALLREVGLEESHADRLPESLSGGQCQRVAIARAIALEPSLVVCDEAISALDSRIQEQILQLLERLQAEKGLAYLFITHDLQAVRRFADRVLVLQGGRMVENGPVAKILDHPEHPYTQRLLAAAVAVHS